MAFTNGGGQEPRQGPRAAYGPTPFPDTGTAERGHQTARAGRDVAGLAWWLGIATFDPALPRAETISADAAATRLGICIGSVHRLIRKGVLPATQLMPSAPWQIPVAALETEEVKTGMREIVGRRPKFYKRFQEDKTLRLPGF